MKEELEKILASDIGDKLKKLQAAAKDKLGIEPEEVMAKYQAEYERLDALLDLDEEQLARRAYVTVSGIFKRDLRSPAKFFEGVVLGAGNVFNMVRTAREDALALWQTDREKAISEGFTTPNGEPLDRKQFYKSSGKPNPEFGKILPEERNIQNVVGVAAPKGKQPKFFRLILGETLAGKVSMSLNTPVRFRANIPDNQEDPNVYRLNPYAHIQFQPFDGELPAIEELYESEILEKFRFPLNELPDFHNREGNDPQRLFATMGDVGYLDDTPNPTTGSLRMVLDDESLPEDHDGFAAWVPPHLQEMIDFDMGSRIYAIGSTASTEYEGRGEVFMMNLFGFYAIPQFKIPRGEAPAGILSKDADQVR